MRTVGFWRELTNILHFLWKYNRFSRDIIVALEAIRQCRRCEVPIYFEAEDLTSDDPLLDVQLTAHLAVAEQDNLSRKDNINWGLHVGAELGTSKLYNKVCFGYTHDKIGNLIINDEEANIVRFIFRLYPDGTTTRKPSKYSGKKVLNETFDKKQLLADLGINDD